MQNVVSRLPMELSDVKLEEVGGGNRTGDFFLKLAAFMDDITDGRSAMKDASELVPENTPDTHKKDKPEVPAASKT